MDSRSLNRLQGKVALLTGAGGGIGKATASLFGQEGATVIVSDVSPERTEEAVAAVKAAGGSVVGIPANVTNEASVKKLFENVVNQFGRVDVVMNCAGIMPILTIPETSEEIWDKVIDINLKGTYLCCKFAVIEMRKSGGGSIINIASGAGLNGVPGLAAYCASKGGVVLLTKAMALDHAREHIRINCLAPGVIDTELNRSWINKTADPEKAVRDLEAGIPIGRMADPMEVAYCALFLATSESSYVTGHPLIVDGGLTAD
ncbi:MAG: glucose 1-dehydrogenase [Anaerolineae bacterium]